jgi:thiazolylpeptide-type bacteriocin precursor
MKNNLQASNISLDGLEIEGLDIDDISVSEFLDRAIEENSDAISKVMAASCTSCECCCSC